MGTPNACYRKTHRDDGNAFAYSRTTAFTAPHTARHTAQYPTPYPFPNKIAIETGHSQALRQKTLSYPLKLKRSLS
jgi:hypothetical protein